MREDLKKYYDYMAQIESKTGVNRDISGLLVNKEFEEKDIDSVVDAIKNAKIQVLQKITKDELEDQNLNIYQTMVKYVDRNHLDKLGVFDPKNEMKRLDYADCFAAALVWDSVIEYNQKINFAILNLCDRNYDSANLSAALAYAIGGIENRDVLDQNLRDILDASEKGTFDKIHAIKAVSSAGINLSMKDFDSISSALELSKELDSKNMEFAEEYARTIRNICQADLSRNRSESIEEFEEPTIGDR